VPKIYFTFPLVTNSSFPQRTEKFVHPWSKRQCSLAFGCRLQARHQCKFSQHPIHYHRQRSSETLTDVDWFVMMLYQLYRLYNVDCYGLWIMHWYGDEGKQQQPNNILHHYFLKEMSKIVKLWTEVIDLWGQYQILQKDIVRLIKNI
jgi:hypothetical protein